MSTKINIPRPVLAKAMQRLRDVAVEVAKEQNIEATELAASVILLYCAGFHAAFVGMRLLPDTPLGEIQPMADGYAESVIAEAYGKDEGG